MYYYDYYYNYKHSRTKVLTKNVAWSYRSSRDIHSLRRPTPGDSDFFLSLSHTQICLCKNSIFEFKMSVFTHTYIPHPRRQTHDTKRCIYVQIHWHMCLRILCMIYRDMYTCIHAYVSVYTVCRHTCRHARVHTHLPPYTLFVHVDVYFFNGKNTWKKEREECHNHNFWGLINPVLFFLETKKLEKRVRCRQGGIRECGGGGNRRRGGNRIKSSPNSNGDFILITNFFVFWWWD